MSVQTIVDVEDALRSHAVSVRTLYGVWEQRQPVPEPSERKASGAGAAAPRQIPWIQTDLPLARRFTELCTRRPGRRSSR